jgi:hypothetical protein
MATAVGIATSAARQNPAMIAAIVGGVLDSRMSYEPIPALITSVGAGRTNFCIFPILTSDSHKTKITISAIEG